MSPHPLSVSPRPSPSPSSRTCSSRSASTSSTSSTRFNTSPFTPRDTSPGPSYEMAQITLRQRKTALSKASKELSIEKASFFLKKADFQREKDEFTAVTNKATLAAKQKRAKEMERLWERVFIAAIVFLAIPVVSLVPR
ncbi:hypothetical protein VE02_08096 [Pseudogymnoascus sp. 03VT05]|nr:hypothetical protein VE02_08096 [Pseudogymnoascus sp. 03VT05]